MEKALLKFAIKKKGNNTYSFIGSDETIDRDGEVIKVDGWNLTPYRKNPVVMWGHRHDIPAIGKAKRVRIENILLTTGQVQKFRMNMILF